MFRLTLGLLLSFAIGGSLGLLGGGGSIITVPVLIYVLGVDARQAIGMSLAVMGLTSFIGTMLHARRGHVVWKTGLFFGLAGAVFAPLGARLTYAISPAALLVLFAVLMMAVAILMLTRSSRALDDRGRRDHPLKAGAAGAFTGVLTGFLGVGGGFLIVPALVLFGSLAMHEAVGTSLLVIAINSFAGLLGHLSHGGFDPVLATFVSLCAAGGMMLGAKLSPRVSADRLRLWFIAFMIAIALLLFAKNCQALFGA